MAASSSSSSTSSTKTKTKTTTKRTKTTENVALQSLKKTNESLKKIEETLKPFLDLVDRFHRQHSDSGIGIDGGGSSSSNPTNDKHSKQVELYQITEAETAIALSIGTLRYMACRLKGQKSNKNKKNDPLRMELDKIRKTLVELRKLKKKMKIDLNTSANEDKEERQRGTSSEEKKRKANSSTCNISGDDKDHLKDSLKRRK
mmetsp:Transcript_23771/g.29953  ORF Transcript_23771/g.29953 Transcript_23771/m.29953 type:complete len:202 (+) Transcript_23771:49-654(+)